MDILERRIIGALLLLLGVSLLTVAIYASQLSALLDMLKVSFRV
jgi:hypothetical protein